MSEYIDFSTSIHNQQINFKSKKSIKKYSTPQPSIKSIYIGNFDWGEVFKPVMVNDLPDFEDKFGNFINNDNIEDYTAIANYLSYGRSMLVMRVVDTETPDHTGVIRARYTGNGVVGINKAGSGLEFYDVNMGCTILNRDDYAIKNLNSAFPSFGSTEKLRVYIKYPSGYMASVLRISICNHNDIDTAEIVDGYLFKEYLGSSLKADEIAIVLHIDGKIVESFVLSTTVGLKNSNNENYFIDEYIYNNSRYIYTLYNKDLSGEIPSIKDVGFRYGDSVQFSSTKKNSLIGSVLYGMNLDMGGIYKIVEDYGYSISVDSFQSSVRSIKASYRNGGFRRDFAISGKNRIRCKSVVDSDRTVYGFFDIEFSNGQNSAPVLGALLPDTHIYYKVGSDRYDGWIRAVILDSVNNFNSVIIESSDNIMSNIGVYIDEDCTVEIIKNSTNTLHYDLDAVADQIEIHGSQFYALSGVDSIGVFSIPNIFQIVDEDTAVAYMDLLISDGRYNKNCYMFMECQYQNVENTDYIFSCASDVAGNWSGFNFYIDNKNGQYYDIVPFGYGSSTLNKLSRKMLNVINYSSSSMSLNDVSNDKTRDVPIRLSINKVKNDIREIFSRFLFKKKSLKDINKTEERLSLYKADIEMNNKDKTYGQIRSFEYQFDVDDTMDVAQCQCFVEFYGVIGIIEFNVVRNLTK